MELSLGSDPRTDILRRLEPLLVQRFGRVRRAAADRRRPEWVLVQGVIGTRSRSEVSNAATDRLLARYGDFETVAKAPLDELAEELGTQTYTALAASRLKDSLSALIGKRGAADLAHLAAMPTGAAMDWLEQLPGVGRKIAAQVMNASTFDRRAIVLDSHHRRILQAWGWCRRKPTPRAPSTASCRQYRRTGAPPSSTSIIS